MRIEAEGSELILKNKAGDYVVIPKKYRMEVNDMIKDGCHGCIDKLVETLPSKLDYAKDGSIYGVAYDTIKDTIPQQSPKLQLEQPQQQAIVNKPTTSNKYNDNFVYTPPSIASKKATLPTDKSEIMKIQSKMYDAGYYNDSNLYKA